MDSHDDVDQLEQRGILAAQRPPRRQHGEGGDAGWDPLPRRGHRHVLPRLPDDVDVEDDDGEEEPAQEAELEGNVMIAELAGPGRWGQAAFPQWFINNFSRSCRVQAILCVSYPSLRPMAWALRKSASVGTKWEAEIGITS